jgi:hypothetical protein
LINCPRSLINRSPPVQSWPLHLLAAKDLGDFVQLIIAAIIIIGSMLASLVAKARQKSEQSKLSDREKPARPEQPVAPPRPQPTVRRTEPPGLPRAARPAMPIPTPPRPPVTLRAAFESLSTSMLESTVAAKPVVPPPQPARRPQRRGGRVAQPAQPQGPHLDSAPLPSELPSQRRRRRQQPAKVAKRRTPKLIMGTSELRRAVIYAELIGKPLSIREEQLW